MLRRMRIPKTRPMIKPHRAHGRFADDALPHADTCFFNVELPAYSSKEIMRKRLETVVSLEWGMSGDVVGNSVGVHDPMRWDEVESSEASRPADGELIFFDSESTDDEAETDFRSPPFVSHRGSGVLRGRRLPDFPLPERHVPRDDSVASLMNLSRYSNSQAQENRRNVHSAMDAPFRPSSRPPAPTLRPPRQVHRRNDRRERAQREQGRADGLEPRHPFDMPASDVDGDDDGNAE